MSKMTVRDVISRATISQGVEESVMKKLRTIILEALPEKDDETDLARKVVHELACMVVARNKCIDDVRKKLDEVLM